jgi:tetratricopeptide (TPR) repeat protein
MSRADRDRRRSGELASVGSTGLLERSLIFDPSFAPAHAAIAWSQAEDLFFCYATHDPKDILDRARHAVGLDDRDALSHLALAKALTFSRKPNSAIDAVKRAIALNPSFAHAHAILGRLLIHSGRCDEGIQQVEQAILLALSRRVHRDTQYFVGRTPLSWQLCEDGRAGTSRPTSP